MELLQLRYFTTVARMLNISRAAEYHRIPQPAMSKTISKLEQELGVKLFNRINNRLSLTQKGNEFYLSVSRALYGLDSALESVHASNDIPSGVLNLKVLQHRSSLADCIIQFRKTYSSVSFYIDCDEVNSSGEAYDFYISGTHPGKLYDRSVPLIVEDFALVVSSSHPLASYSSVNANDLQHVDFVAVSDNSKVNRAARYKDYGFDPPISILCDDLHCLMKYVSSGLYVAVGPRISWQSFASHDVKFVKLEPVTRRFTYLYWNSDNRSISALLFREYIERYYKAINGQNAL